MWGVVCILRSGATESHGTGLDQSLDRSRQIDSLMGLQFATGGVEVMEGREAESDESTSP